MSYEILSYSPMTPSQLKYLYESTTGNKNYFSRDTMRFFGDTMRNYGVREISVDGKRYYELWRRKPVNGGLMTSRWFDAETLLITNSDFDDTANCCVEV